MPAKDIEVLLEGDTLVIRGEKRAEKSEEKEGRSYSERFFGTFERRIQVPEGVEASSIDAKTSDGVLTIKVPVPAAPQIESQKIEIKAG